MTLYRHFASKDELVAEYLRCLAADAGALLGRARGGASGRSARATARLAHRRCEAHVVDADQRGCALANAAVELPEKDHPARA